MSTTGSLQQPKSASGYSLTQLAAHAHGSTASDGTTGPPQTQVELAAEASKAVRELRRSVRNVFMYISGGVKSTSEESSSIKEAPSSQSASTSAEDTASTASSTSSDAKTNERKFFKDLMMRLKDLQEKYANLQKLMDQMQAAPPFLGRHPTAGVSSTFHRLVADSSSEIDRDNELLPDVYEEALRFASRCEGMTDAILAATASLTQPNIVYHYAMVSNQFNRNTSYFTQPKPPPEIRLNRDIRQLIQQHQYVRLDQYIEQQGSVLILLSILCQVGGPMHDMSQQPTHVPAVLMRCALIIRKNTFSPQWFMAKGPHESFYDIHGQIDLTTPSMFHAFERLSVCTNATILSMYAIDHQPEDNEAKYQKLFANFLATLNLHNQLFTKPCRICERLLKDNMPPLMFNRKVGFVHEGCKQLKE